MIRKLIKLIIIFFLIIGAVYLVYQRLSWSHIPSGKVTNTYSQISHDNLRTNSASVLLRKLRDSLQLPSLSAAVSLNGRLIWADACGYADIDKRRIADINTIYRIGSTSKAITSVGVMILYQDGKIDLDTPIADIIKDYPVKKWTFNMRQLLSHTAGMPDYEDLNLKGLLFSLLNFRQFNSVEEGLTVFKDVPLLYKPGTNYKYNSFGPVLASRVIEIKSNETFEAFLRKKIFIPLQMNATFFDKGENNDIPIAKFYEIDNKGKYRNWHTFGLPKQEQDLSYKWAGGGMLSTPSDLVKLGGKLIKDDSFIKKQVKNEFFTRQKLTSGRDNPDNYALGWRVADDYMSVRFKSDKKFKIIHHAGVSKGSMNFLCLFPEEKIAINISTNGRSEKVNFSSFWDSLMQLAALFISQNQ